MRDRQLPVVPEDSGATPIHTVTPAGLDGFVSQLPDRQRAYLGATAFSGRARELAFLPSEQGIDGAVLGLGEDGDPWTFGDLAYSLPERTWRLASGPHDVATAVLGFCLGAYRYTFFKQPSRPAARLAVPSGQDRALAAAAAIWMARDLVNAPANLLGPSELAAQTVALGERFGAKTSLVEGENLSVAYPTIWAVGRGSSRGPVVAAFTWRGSGAKDDAPLVSLCGKGVCFDSGGYDLKPASSMLRMKKDMGGAAVMLATARMIMDADLPVRLAVRIGCVENSVSGHAMRPLDVVRTRRGLTVEIGNTDAEGRLVLCDLLAEASDERPWVLVDGATLTGAARVALGPDLPALFTTSERWASALSRAGREHHDAVWRLPLWDGYGSWLDSSVADLNNVSSKPMAGAITAALFMKRFVPSEIAWCHLDLYAWNDAGRPGRPEGGEAQGARAVFQAIADELLAMSNDRNTAVT